MKDKIKILKNQEKSLAIKQKNEVEQYKSKLA